jgi:hypothetical protein
MEREIRKLRAALAAKAAVVDDSRRSFGARSPAPVDGSVARA